MTEQQRSALTQTAVSAAQARAVVNRFLLSRVGSVFAAGTPELDSLAHLWKVPILYTPPDFTGEEVGLAQVNALTGEIQRQRHTCISDSVESSPVCQGTHRAGPWIDSL